MSATLRWVAEVAVGGPRGSRRMLVAEDLGELRDEVSAAVRDMIAPEELGMWHVRVVVARAPGRCWCASIVRCVERGHARVVYDRHSLADVAALRLYAALATDRSGAV